MFVINIEITPLDLPLKMGEVSLFLDIRIHRRCYNSMRKQI